MTVTCLTEAAPITFAGIDKGEYKNLAAYLKSKGVKMRNVDAETNHQIDLSDEEGSAGDEEDPEQPRKKKGSAKNHQ